MSDRVKRIKIDLCNLTPELLERCRPYMGHYDYRSPCVIGVLMHPDQRERLADFVKSVDKDNYEDDVEYLMNQGILVLPEDQFTDAVNIQYCFDNMEWEDVLKIANKYITKTEDQNK